MQHIYIGADHAGFELKEKIKLFLKKEDRSVADLGNTKYDLKDDYPDFAKKVAERVAKEGALGILLCGTGHGVCIVANKIKGIRAVTVTSTKDARLTREHDQSNILCLGGRTTSSGKARKIVKTWLNTPYSKEARHKKRIEKIVLIERGR